MYGPHAITCLVIYLIKKKKKKKKTRTKQERKRKAYHYFLEAEALLSTAEISTKNSKLRIECSCFIGNYWHTGQLVQFVKTLASEPVKS